MSAHRLGLAVVVVCFCLPLFVGLGRADLENDEAIYSFAVDRVLETGDWLVPRMSPSEDAAFLEKPPLKFWIVAGAIRVGLLPHNEFGLRFWDAVFGAIAFLYVYAIGCRLAGSVCGVVAVLALFVFRQLLFEHGLRSDDMEGPLFLCYCAGVYHYLRWTASTRDAPRRGHAVATMLYFVLGFMTKFVAALFLPLVLGMATLAVPRYRTRFARDWKLWAAVDLFGAALIVPWFLYVYHRFGSGVWEIMLKTHVLVRMTSGLDPSHLQPWSYYWVNLYRSFSYSGASVLVFGGVVVFFVQTVRRRSAEGLVVLLWFVLPLVLISIGASKLIHYAYPFLPPLALAAGYLAALIVRLAPAPLDRIPWPRALMAIVAAAAVAVVAATVARGELRIDLGGPIVFRSAAILRPALLALLAAVLASRKPWTPRLAACLLVVLLLPVSAYAQNLARLEDGPAPLRTLRDCLLRVEATTSGRPAGLYVDVPDSQMEHPAYYYLRQVRPWTRASSLEPVRLAPYVDDPARARPILIAASRYQELLRDSEIDASPDVTRASPSMVVLDDALLVLLPGPYAACRQDTAASGTSR